MLGDPGAGGEGVDERLVEAAPELALCSRWVHSASTSGPRRSPKLSAVNSGLPS
jgi:hypothetical protein